MPQDTTHAPARTPRRLARLAAGLLFALTTTLAPAQTEPPVETVPAAAPAAETPGQAPAQPVMTAVPSPRVVAPTQFAELGSEDGQDKAHLQFTPMGAGISRLSLPDTYSSVAHQSHIVLQSTQTVNSLAVVPFALTGVHIDGRFVDLTGVKMPGPVWAQTAPGVFEAYVDAADGQPLLRITRRYELKGSERYGFTVSNSVENLSGTAQTVRLVQTGPLDLPRAENNYAGDMRRVRFGTVPAADRPELDQSVRVDDLLARRTDFLGKRVASPSGVKVYPAQYFVWPNEKNGLENRRLSWLALTDRYFAVIMHPEVQPGAPVDERVLAGTGPIDRLLPNPASDAASTVMVLRLNGEDTALAPGASATSSFGVYAGPMSRPTIRKDAVLVGLNMPEVVVFNLGGFCSPCTFSWLTDALMAVLRLFHAISGDWAIAIMLLVVLVRGVLHPVTRWSQIRMQRFGVQMQSMAPKQAKLREKYKDDPKQLQAEMGKLWKEEGINPAGMLGCLPMFLQTPVWMALYATLFFAIELRQNPGFYGVFQSVTNNHWQFLADLSQPDHAIPLPVNFSLPLWGTLSAINLLPILMGGLMWVHQKFLTPPTTATMTPEQEQQQKIIKVMMVVMFPIMMYAAPAGLTIYFITNSVLGIAEHKWIRAHMNRHGLLDLEKIKAERATKGPGFMSRLTDAAETQRRLREQASGGRPVDPRRKKK